MIPISTATVNTLKGLISGLMFDDLGTTSAEPWEAFEFSAKGPVEAMPLARALGLKSSAADQFDVLESAETFLHDYLERHNGRPPSEVLRVEQMVSGLKVTLSDLHIAVVGKPGSRPDGRYPVYLVGRTVDGTYAGVRSVAVWP